MRHAHKGFIYNTAKAARLFCYEITSITANTQFVQPGLYQVYEIGGKFFETRIPDNVPTNQDASRYEEWSRPMTPEDVFNTAMQWNRLTESIEKGCKLHEISPSLWTQEFRAAQDEGLNGEG